MKTTTTFWFGLSVSSLLSLLLGILVALLVSRLLPSGRFFLSPYLQWLAVVSITASGTYGLVEWGKFQVPLGMEALEEYLGSPTGRKYGPGIGWLIPKLFSVKVVDTQSALTKGTKQEYTIANGFEVTLDQVLTFYVDDLVKFQKLKPDEASPFVETQLEGATRKYMIERPIEMTHTDVLAFATNAESALKAAKTMALFKGETKSKGPAAILEELNKEENLGTFGLRAQQLQIKDATFSEEIEKTIESILREILERPARVTDAQNKKAVMATLREAMETTGVNFSKLPNEMRAEYASRLIDTALALEGKAQVIRYNFGGKPPKGMLFTPKTT